LHRPSTIAPVRFTVWPSLISRSLPRCDADIVGFEIERHPRTPFSNSTISPACVVEAVGARDASPTELPDLGNLGFLLKFLITP
jgi:hypothetical protein